MVFFDTSIIIAYYLPETYSEQVQERYSSNPLPVISSYVELEVVSVFARLVRADQLSLDDAKQMADLFSTHVRQGYYARIDLQEEHYRAAREYITRFDLPLKAPDALHLAAAAIEQLPLITADRQLARNADALGVRVELLAVD
jgi:predicted nucleic acid-binding protein